MGWRRSVDQITAIGLGKYIYWLVAICGAGVMRGEGQQIETRREGWIEVDLGKCNVMARGGRVLESWETGRENITKK